MSVLICVSTFLTKKLYVIVIEWTLSLQKKKDKKNNLKNSGSFEFKIDVMC